METVLIVGTQKGAFLLWFRPAARAMARRGPLLKGWKVTAAARDDRGRTWVATASDIYRAALRVSGDLAARTQVDRGPQYPEGGPRRLRHALERGLPDHTYAAVLRHALATDGHDPGGAYVGTT